MLLNKLRGKIRVKSDLKTEASEDIMDSQSIYWGDNRSLNEIDGNKKRALNVMLLWTRMVFLMTVMITITCIHDGKTTYLLAKCLKELGCNIKVFLGRCRI